MDEGKVTGGVFDARLVGCGKREAYRSSFNALDGEYGASAYTFVFFF